MLAEAVKCLLEHAGTGGGKGEQGHPGDKGDKGDKGEKGDTGESGTGLNFDLPHIVAINWGHNKRFELDDFPTIREFGLIIAFDREMLPDTISRADVRCLKAERKNRMVFGATAAWSALLSRAGSHGDGSGLTKTCR